MNKTKHFIGITILMLLTLVSCKETKNEKATVKEELATYAKQKISTKCLADSVWFATNPTTGKRKTPAPKEDISSVFGNNETVSNCDFHQWSWQKFLWLTNDVSGEPLFMKNLIQVDNQNTPVAEVGSSKIILSAKENRQATGDILRSNSAFSKDNTSYDVYYSIHVDSTLYNSINKYAKMDKNQYVDVSFPVGALELKVAWVDAKAIKDTSSYFLTNASIAGKDTQVALLGMHVVGIVYNHPEFVWATFEHDDLVPYYDWEKTTTSDIPVTSETNKLFFNKNATATIANLASHYKDPSKDSLNVFAVNKYGVPRQAKNTFLDTSQKGAENYNNIDEINKSVKSQLNDIWNNYFYNGSIWVDTEGYKYPTEQAQLLNTLGDTLSNSAPGKLTRGSVAAYNITMETYEQLGFSPPAHIYQQSVATLGNCFSCHSSDNSPLTLSHVFNGAVLKAKNKTKEETKQKHLNEIVEFIKKLK
ncbi:hypothetical protein [Tenacibaculum xiamenense]|uniref:hypothetical protein n=1 Tax=Tenacibaculum xiamenense TaxID=1261553 RepID=UPI003893E893